MIGINLTEIVKQEIQNNIIYIIYIIIILSILISSNKDFLGVVIREKNMSHTKYMISFLTTE
jgi:hypothetical protein